MFQRCLNRIGPALKYTIPLPSKKTCTWANLTVEIDFSIMECERSGFYCIHYVNLIEEFPVIVERQYNRHLGI